MQLNGLSFELDGLLQSLRPRSCIRHTDYFTNCLSWSLDVITLICVHQSNGQLLQIILNSENITAYTALASNCW